LGKEQAECKMIDINDRMPKIPGMLWGALTNIKPTPANLNYLLKVIPSDRKWHLLHESPGETTIDGVSVRTKSRESMT
jgi:hypothetical protein